MPWRLQGNRATSPRRALFPCPHLATSRIFDAVLQSTSAERRSVSLCSVPVTIVREEAESHAVAAGSVAERSETRRVTTEITTGEAATRTLNDASFRQEWAQLHADCPWATVCQGLAFSDAWWSVYGGLYEPVLVQSRTVDGALCGLLLLARLVGSSEVVHVGAHHAEYHTWLALPWASDAVITGALRELDARGVTQRIRFHFLAPGSPIPWIESYEGALSPLCIVRSHRRGMHALDSGGGGNHDSLRKPSNRSKLRRLAKNGEVSLRVLSSAAELAPWLPEIIAMCDARQGAVHDSLPFRDDPRKARFHLALADCAGLAHVAILVAGEELLAAHIGLINGKSVLLGLIAHAPHHGRHSPGKILLLMLSQRLAADGFDAFDLTPGGTYKERFADRFDDVQSLDVRFTAADALFQSARRSAGTLARRMLPDRRERATKRSNGAGGGDRIYQLTRTIDRDFLERCRHAAEAVAAPFKVRVNHVQDLLRFGGPDVHRDVLLRFLAQSIARLETGDIMVTVSDARELVHLCWLRRFESAAGHAREPLHGTVADFVLIEHGFSSIRSSAQLEGGAIASGVLALAPVHDESVSVLYKTNRSSESHRPAEHALEFTTLHKRFTPFAH